jgi:alpha-L-fucosidase 2
MAVSPLILNGTVVEHRDVEYVRYGDARLALDAAIPQTSGLAPAVIVVHGGGWVRGDRRVDVAPLLDPLSEAGFAWFSISYRLMNNDAQFGAAIDDVAAAIRFVKAHAAEYHVDPNRIALVGESAGGQLAAMAALRDDSALRVRAVVGLYAPTDLESLARKSQMVPQWIRDNVRGTPWEGLILASLKQLSPIEHVHRGMPPLLLIHGTADTLVPFEQSRAMCERVKAVGGSCELYPVDGAGHGIRWWESTAHAKGYKREMVRWLKEQLD